MTDRKTISQVVESLFEDWIDKNINVHPLAVENMRILESDALALLEEQENCENCAIAIEDRPPVVRCKDCKHSTIHCIESVIGEPLYDCHNPCWNYDDIPTMKWDWFCADGERRTDDA